MSSRTDFGSNSKMADFDAARFLSGDITASEVEKLKTKEFILVAKELDANLQVEVIPKAEVKAKLLHALTARSMLKGTVKLAEMTELQFQLEMKTLEMQENERREQREMQEREAERQERENREQRVC